MDTDTKLEIVDQLKDLSQEDLIKDALRYKDLIEVDTRLVEAGKALDRIKKTEDYKLVFEDSYLKAESERLFTILVSGNINQARAEDMEVRLSAIRYFNLMFGNEEFSVTGKIEIEAINAAENLKENKEYLVLLESSIQEVNYAE